MQPLKIIPMNGSACLDTPDSAYSLTLADMQELRDQLTAQIARIMSEQAAATWQTIDPFCVTRAAVS
jgi:hypothetical protein